MTDWNFNLLLAEGRDIDWSEYLWLLIIFGVAIFNALSKWLKNLLEKNTASKKSDTDAAPKSSQAVAPRPITNAAPQQRLPIYARGRTPQAPSSPAPVQRGEPVHPHPSLQQPIIRPRPVQPRPTAPQSASRRAMPRPTITATPAPPPRQTAPPPPPSQAPRPPSPHRPQPVRTARVVQQSKFHTATGKVQQAQAISSPAKEPLIEAVPIDEHLEGLPQQLKHRHELVNAIIMAEILGKPLALRDEFMGGHVL